MSKTSAKEALIGLLVAVLLVGGLYALAIYVVVKLVKAFWN